MLQQQERMKMRKKASFPKRLKFLGGAPNQAEMERLSPDIDINIAAQRTAQK